MASATASATTGDEYDVVIVGAGISGINAAYRLQERMPGCRYVILEAQDVLGGTWALFKYPGIRSDSDLYTFGFAWKSWTGPTRFANGDQIVSYMTEAAREYGIDKKILYKHKVKQVDWSSKAAQWTVSADQQGKQKTLRARFLIFGTGYYNYDSPLDVSIPGLDRFKGQVIHPQFWPEDLDYKNKRVCIIGSGATAVTLLPNMAKEAAHVTMLQRSPGYVMTLPNQRSMLPRFTPRFVQSAFDYLRYLVMPFLFYKFCTTFPRAARKVIRSVTTKQLPSNIPHDPHFQPAYNPWEQRLCMSPDGDFFESLRAGKADVATGKIKTINADTIMLEDGSKIPADLIVTATGLKLQLAGGTKIVVDGQEARIPEKFLWRGMMLEGIPNLAYCIGYTNASWTLGADCTAIVVCRLMQELAQRNKRIVVPEIDHKKDVKVVSVFNLNSTYVQKGENVLPKAADSGPFQPRRNYFRDYAHAKLGDISSGIVLKA